MEQSKMLPATTSEEQAQLVARPDRPVGSVIDGKKLVNQLAASFRAVIGKDPDRLDRFLRMAVNCLQANPSLQKCDQLSFALALMSCAELNLLPGATLGHAFIVPYWDEQKKQYIAQFQMGYRGYFDLAMRHPKVKRGMAMAVRQGDVFEYEYGFNERLKHIPAANGGGELIAAWVCFWLDDGSHVFKVIGPDRVARAKSSSQMGRKDKGPWTTDPEPMWAKTAIRAIAPFVPMHHDFARALELDGDDTQLGHEASELISGGDGPAAKILPRPDSRKVTVTRGPKKEIANDGQEEAASIKQPDTHTDVREAINAGDHEERKPSATDIQKGPGKLVKQSKPKLADLVKLQEAARVAGLDADLGANFNPDSSEDIAAACAQLEAALKEGSGYE